MMKPEDFPIGSRVVLVRSVSRYLPGELGTVVGHTGAYVSVKFDSQPDDVQWTDCEPGELADYERNYWPAFVEAWDEQRFQAYLKTWLNAPERTLGDLKALCDFLGYGPVTELATLDRLAYLERRDGPAETPPTA
jgi:hypothetical protein